MRTQFICGTIVDMPSGFVIKLLLLTLWLLPLRQTALAASSDQLCVPPPDLKREISSKYPGRSIVTLTDLSDDDRKFFQKEHGAGCPGLVAVDFYGDGKPTWALVLVTKERSKGTAELLLARQVEEKWEIRSLDKATASVPVVWRQAAGTYSDVYGDKAIQAKNAVVVLTEYESWSILYAWTGHEVSKIWLSD